MFDDMGWMEFVSSIVGSLAWPFAAVITAGVFRKQLREVLGTRLHRIKAGPVEMELFARKLAETEAEVDPIPAKTAGALPEGVAADLGPIVDTSPAAAVMEAHARVERRLREILSDAGVNDTRPGVRQLARTAAEKGLITGESVRAVEGITVMRNLAAHGQAHDLTPERAREYLDLVDAVLFSLGPPRRP
jgi:hypothetical protein